MTIKASELSGLSKVTKSKKSFEERVDESIMIVNLDDIVDYKGLKILLVHLILFICY